MIKICNRCEVEYSTDNKRRKYCSLGCAYSDRGGKVESECEYCGDIFLARRAQLANGFDKYCNQLCMAKAMVTSVEKECEHCGKPYTVPFSRSGISRFCSNECRDTFRRTRIEKQCETCGKSMFAEPGKLANGWDRFCSKKCQGIGSSGENHYNWKGGITPEHLAIRASQPYKNWRSSVFARDNWTCQDCGAKGDIHAHHIFTFADFEEHRFDVWNGVTLCRNCHAKIHPNLKLISHTSRL